MSLSTSAVSVLAASIPNPTPEQPPGTDGIVTLLNWLSWIVIICGLAGFLISLIILAFSAWSGREVSGAKGLVVSIVVCILSVGAGTIIQFFI